MTGFFRDGCCTHRPPGPGQPHDLRGGHRRVPRAPARHRQRPVDPDAAVRVPRPGAGRPLVRHRAQLGPAYRDGAPAPVVLASTNAAVLEIVPLELLRERAVDVPADPSSLEG